jgi:hypothetical protein
MEQDLRRKKEREMVVRFEEEMSNEPGFVLRLHVGYPEPRRSIKSHRFRDWTSLYTVQDGLQRDYI